MLLGQDLRRGQEHSLMAALQGQHQEQGRHDRLSASDVALEQAPHGPLPAEVLHQLPEDSLLGSSQAEGEDLPGQLPGVVVDPIGSSLPPSIPLAALPGQSELLAQELAVDQSAMGRGPMPVPEGEIDFLRRGVVEESQGLGKGHQTPGNQDFPWNRLRKPAGQVQAGHRGADPSAEPLGSHAGDSRIDGMNGADFFSRSVRRFLPVRVGENQAPVPAPDLAVEEELIPFQPLLQVGLIEPDHRKLAGGPFDRTFDKGPAAPEPANPEVPDSTPGGDPALLHDLSRVHRVPAILVPSRKMEEKVGEGLEGPARVWFGDYPSPDADGPVEASEFLDGVLVIDSVREMVPLDD